MTVDTVYIIKYKKILEFLVLIGTAIKSTETSG